MALQPEELFGSAVSQTPNLRAYPDEDGVRPGTLVQLGADAELAHLLPLNHAVATGNWSIWTGAAGTEEISTITANATAATAGDFTLTVDGETTAAIAFDATAAEIETALELLSNVTAGDVAAVATTGVDLGDNNAVVTLTWGGDWADTDVPFSADMTGLTGNAHVLAEATPGTAGLSVDGFVWAPGDPHQGLLAGESLMQVFRAGLIHAGDIPLPAGESQNALYAELRSSDLRQKGVKIQGLDGVA
jgi:hypothetical protein